MSCISELCLISCAALLSTVRLFPQVKSEWKAAQQQHFSRRIKIDSQQAEMRAAEQ